MNAVRKPSRFATYSGDVRNILNEQPKGPNTFGELLYQMTADYNASTNTTRVGFSYIAPPVEVTP